MSGIDPAYLDSIIESLDNIAETNKEIVKQQQRIADALEALAKCTSGGTFITSKVM